MAGPPAGTDWPAPALQAGASSVNSGQSLSKQARPKRINIYTSCFNKGIDLTLCEGLLVVMWVQGVVDTGELGRLVQVGLILVAG